MHFHKALYFAGIVGATFTITDPSDVIGTTQWTADNALIADYNVSPVRTVHETIRLYKG